MEKEAKEKIEEAEFGIGGKKTVLVDERVRNEALRRRYEDIFFKDDIKEAISKPEVVVEQKENLDANVEAKGVDETVTSLRQGEVVKKERKPKKDSAKGGRNAVGGKSTDKAKKPGSVPKNGQKLPGDGKAREKLGSSIKK